LANCPTLGGGGKISILSSFGNEIVIGAGPSTGDWPTARHLEEEERYLYISSFGNEIVIGAGPSTGDWPTARHLEEERYLYISSFGNEIVIIKKILN